MKIDEQKSTDLTESADKGQERVDSSAVELKSPQDQVRHDAGDREGQRGSAIGGRRAMRRELPDWQCRMRALRGGATVQTPNRCSAAVFDPFT